MVPHYKMQEIDILLSQTPLCRKFENLSNNLTIMGSVRYLQIHLSPHVSLSPLVLAPSHLPCSGTLPTIINAFLPGPEGLTVMEGSQWLPAKRFRSGSYPSLFCKNFAWSTATVCDTILTRPVEGMHYKKLFVYGCQFVTACPSAMTPSSADSSSDGACAKARPTFSWCGVP